MSTSPVIEKQNAVFFGTQELSVSCSPDFPITPYTEFILEDFPDVRDQRVLDFGTGCGILALASVVGGAKEVIACDISDAALALTQENSIRNGCKIIRTVLVDKDPLISLKGLSFDTIICNPASLPTRDASKFFWSGGAHGLGMIYLLIEVAANCLLPGGRLRFVHTSLAPLHKTLSRLEECGFVGTILRTKQIAFRPFYEGLKAYFADLRAQSQIFYDMMDDGTLYELLYLVEAKHFE